LLGVSSAALHRWVTEGRIVSLVEMGEAKVVLEAGYHRPAHRGREAMPCP